MSPPGSSAKGPGAQPATSSPSRVGGRRTPNLRKAGLYPAQCGTNVVDSQDCAALQHFGGLRDVRQTRSGLVVSRLTAFAANAVSVCICETSSPRSCALACSFFGFVLYSALPDTKRDLALTVPEPAVDGGVERGSDLSRLRISRMRRPLTPAALVTAAMVLAACGQTLEQRAATGATAGTAVDQARKPD